MCEAMKTQNLTIPLLLLMHGLSAILVSGTVVATTEGPRITLDNKTANELGIFLETRNFSYELLDAPSPLFFELDLTTFEACEVRDVGMNVRDASGILVFGTGISHSSNAHYPFRLGREYLKTTIIGISCEDEPDVLSRMYQFILGDLVQFPE